MLLAGTVGTDLFVLFYDNDVTSTLFKLDYSFNSDNKIAFSDDLNVIEQTVLTNQIIEEETPSITFTEIPDVVSENYSPTLTDNKVLA